jgi:pectate lyase
MAQTATDLANQALIHVGSAPVITDITTDTSVEGVTIRSVADLSRISILRKHPWKFARERKTLTVKSITGAADNGSGLIRITSAGHGFSTSDVVNVVEVMGTTEAQGKWTITVISSSTFDLQGSTFSNTYVSGGYVGLAADHTFTFKIPFPSLMVRFLAPSREERFGYSLENQYILTDETSVKIRYIKDNSTYSEWDPLAYECLALAVASKICYKITQSTSLKDNLINNLTMLLKTARNIDSTERDLEIVEAEQWIDSRWGSPREFVRDPGT